MNEDSQPSAANAIVWHSEVPTFRGLPLEIRSVDFAGLSLKVVAMADATQLLDHPDCASRFLDADVAPYGVELWPAAIMLAQHIADVPPPGRAFELGCGLGFVSMAAARLGWNIVAGDHEPTSLAFARENARLNGVSGDIFRLFDWNVTPAFGTFDCILGADILYQLNNHGPILHCLGHLLSKSGVALISDPNRGVADRFPDAARAAGFVIESIPSSAPGPSGQVDGRIFRLYRPA